MEKYKLFAIIICLVASCNTKQLNLLLPQKLKEDSYMWKNRLEALKYYEIDLSIHEEYYLIETYVIYNKGHWGCFYIDSSKYCFKRPDVLEPIRFVHVEYNELLLTSLKENELDTLWHFSKSFDHKIISPTTYFIFSKYENEELKQYKIPAFSVEAEKPPDDL